MQRGVQTRIPRNPAVLKPLVNRRTREYEGGIRESTACVTGRPGLFGGGVVDSAGLSTSPVQSVRKRYRKQCRGIGAGTGT